jgi:aerobic carbon-monoxide dehydrogenase large subunit
MGFEGIGASVRRKEDVRFLSGKGNYADDINRPGQLYAVIKRSDRPHARINGIDTRAAAASPGVVQVFTGADLEAESIGSLPCGWQIHSKDGAPMAEPRHPRARGRQSAPCRRSGRRGNRRNETTGQERR